MSCGRGIGHSHPRYDELRTVIGHNPECYNVIIEVSGGVAEVTYSDEGIAYVLIDYDNKETHEGTPQQASVESHSG